MYLFIDSGTHYHTVKLHTIAKYIKYFFCSYMDMDNKWKRYRVVYLIMLKCNVHLMHCSVITEWVCLWRDTLPPRNRPMTHQGVPTPSLRNTQCGWPLFLCFKKYLFILLCVRATHLSFCEALTPVVILAECKTNDVRSLRIDIHFLKLI